MNAEKASTLRLLREGMGQPVQLLESKGGDGTHEVIAHLPATTQSTMIPVMFLITTLAFLEADSETEVDGWTPADFLSHLRFESGTLHLRLEVVRGRPVFTDVSLTSEGELKIQTRGRGLSATRWLSYVEGRSHLRKVNLSS